MSTAHFYLLGLPTLFLYSLSLASETSNASGLHSDPARITKPPSCKSMVQPETLSPRRPFEHSDPVNKSNSSVGQETLGKEFYSRLLRDGSGVGNFRNSKGLLPLQRRDPSSVAISHSLRGRILWTDTKKIRVINISLAHSNGNLVATKTLDYDRTFSFENLHPGGYILTIQQEGDATIVRPIEIKAYPSSKIVFLEIQLSGDASATIKELVKEHTPNQTSGREEVRTVVSPRAAKEFQKGLEQSGKGDHFKAIEHLQRAIREAPNFFEAYHNLGTEYQKLKEWQKAVEMYQKAISLQSDSGKPYVNLGSVYLTLGQADAALESFKTALRFDEALVIAHLGLGQIFLQRKDLGAAQEHLETATRLSPSQTKTAFLLLVQIQLQQGHPDRAKYFLENLLKYFPNDPDGLKIKQDLGSQSSTRPETE